MHRSLRALLALSAVLIAPASAMAAQPSITITAPAAGGAYATAETVNADYSCSPDPGTLAPVTSCAGDVANNAPIDTATAGTKTFTVNATDSNGDTNTAVHTYTVDGTAPAIALTTPAQGAVFANNEAVNAVYSCTDLGGAGLASCTGTVPSGQPLNTSAGTHTFTVTAIDNAGNTTTVTHSYRASICTRTAANAVSCDIWARTGTVDLPGAANLPTKTFADHGGAPAITQVGGPTLDALAGDTVTVTLHNDLSEPIALAVPQQPMAPATSKIAAGGQATYSFVARLGTSIYEAGSAVGVAALDENVAKQVGQGLYGALVVRPASQTRQAYGTAATAYDEEALLLLSDIDPELNANPGTFDMTTFAPKYQLINGRPYDGTANGTLPIVSGPGHDVLLRMVNAGVHDHPIGLLGLRESVVGESSLALRYPRSAIATSVVPGGTADALVHLPSAASAANHYALYDAALHLYSNSEAGYGGMLTTIDATGAWTTTCAGPVASRVNAPATTTGAADLTFSAYVTRCAAAPASTVTAAEYFIDTVGTDGSGTTIPLSANPLSGTITQAQILGLSDGRHTVYVHGQDSTGAWGEVSSDTFLVTRIGPSVNAMSIAPNPTNHAPGTAHLAATADATAHAGRTVAAAEYFVDPVGTPAPGTGTALTVSDNPTASSLDGDVPIAALGNGAHTILVEAQDDLGNWGASESIQLMIDLSGPVTTAVVVSPNPNNGTLDQDGFPGFVWVTAKVTDSGPNQSAIKAAEGFVDPAGTPADGSGWTMVAVDGVFDEPVEDVYAQIPVSEIARLSDGSHVLSVHGLDAAGNWGTLANGTLQIDKTGPAITAKALSSATVHRPGTVQLSATAADGSNVDRFEYFLDSGAATTVNVAPAPTASISNRPITITTFTTGTLHYVYVRAHDAAGNWGTWNQLPLTVTNPLAPLSTPVLLDPLVVPLTGPLTPVTRGIASVAVTVTGQARLVKITTREGSVRARFVFAPHGVTFHASKTIVQAHDKAHHTVLWVQVRGNAKHGYHMRAISGRKHTAWLSLKDRRVVLEAAVQIGQRPSLKRAH